MPEAIHYISKISSGFKSHLAHFFRRRFLSPSHPPPPPPQRPPHPQKKICPEKNCLYFGKWNFLALILKRFLYFRKLNPALFSPSSKNKKIYPDKISYTLGNGHPEKTSYTFSKGSFSFILGNGNPEKNSLYFSKWNFLVFPETFYISGNGNSRARKNKIFDTFLRPII